MSLWSGLPARCMCGAPRAEPLTHGGEGSAELARINCDENSRIYLTRSFSAEDAEGFAEDAELLTQEEIDGVLHNLLEGLQELGPRSAVDYAVIAGHRYAHRLANDNLSVTHDRFRGRGAYCQNCSFGWIDYGGEFINTEHPQIADREGRARIFFRL